MTIPEQPDGRGGSDPDKAVMLRRLLDSQAASYQELAIMEMMDLAEDAASAAWRAADGTPPAGRFQLALRAAVEALEGIGLAVAEADGDKAGG